LLALRAMIAALIRFPGDHVLVLLADAAAPCASASCRLSFLAMRKIESSRAGRRGLSGLQPFAAPLRHLSCGHLSVRRLSGGAKGLPALAPGI